MNPSSPATQRLLIGVFSVLVIASITGWILSKFAKTDSARRTVENLNARINSWWLMVVVLLGALWLGGRTTTVVFALISFMALREFITVTPTRRADHMGLFISFFVVLPFQYWLVHTGWYGMFTIAIPVYAFIILPVIAVSVGDVTDFLERSARTQWGLMVCVYFISYIPMMRELGGEGLPEVTMGGAGLIIYLVAVIQGSDVLQYVWGKLLGRHKIAPKLSPKKTVEGFALGILSASGLGVLLRWLTPFNAWQAFVVSLALCVLGFFGGLVMSAIKRDRGIKDWGTLIEGHGGMMDRIDSLCFSAPLYFHILRYFFTP